MCFMFYLNNFIIFKSNSFKYIFLTKNRFNYLKIFIFTSQIYKGEFLEILTHYFFPTLHLLQKFYNEFC